MILKLLCLCAALYVASGRRRFEVLRLPRWFYPTNKYVASNLVDSSRPRPNERMDLMVKFPFLGNQLCEDQEWWTYPSTACVKVNPEGYSSVWINKNGILSFGDDWRDPFLNSFARVAFPAIAPLWSLLGFGSESAVYYEQVNRQAALRKAKRDITEAFPCAAGFEPTLVVVVTWYKMDIDQGCVTEGRLWCNCLIRYGHDFCVCDVLPIQEYCDCVAANDPNICECVTEIPEKALHCECLKTKSSEFCQCQFDYYYSENYCQCVEETNNPEYCNCLDYDYYSDEFCECIHIDGNYYYECLFRKKRDVSDQIDKDLRKESKVRNKRAPPDLNMGDSGVSTFQAVLITDETQSYVIFNYGSIQLQENVDGTIQGIVGFDGGIREYPFGPEFNHKFSYSADLKMLITESNVGRRGRWMYRVDGDRVLEPAEC